MTPIDENKLRAFGALIVRMQMKQNLGREEVRAAFGQIWRNEQPELQQGAFIGSLRQKGETLDEIIGLAESHNDEWQAHFPEVVHAREPHLGIVGVGMDTLKTINVSSGAAVIAAACGVYVHKIAAPGMTGISGSFETFMLMGVDPDVEPRVAFKAVEETRLGYTPVVGAALHKTGVFRVLSQLRCGTSIHLAGPMGFHSGERHKIIGVPDPLMVPMVIAAMKALGYKRALVPCGGSVEFPGRHMDELSNLGPTDVAELHEDGRIEQYVVHPADAGLPTAKYEEVAPAKTPLDNVRVVAQVLAGLEGGARLDLLALNAAACLKLMGKVSDLKSGVEKAKAAVHSGAAIAQLRALIHAQNRDPAAGLAQLDALIEAR